MATITDRGMQARPQARDQWLFQAFKRGAGVFVGRITPRGERLFYFRYASSEGDRPFLPIGPYHPKGKDGLTLAQAYARACELSELYRGGIRDLHTYLQRQREDQERAEAASRLAAAEADYEAELQRQRRITVRQLFERWASIELAPHLRADGKRVGRKDGGEFTRRQFERHLFPRVGEVAAADLRRADLLAILDALRAAGKLRTCNVLLADLKQMLRFAVGREIVPHNPLETVTKRDAGGADVERSRVLGFEELATLALQIDDANMGERGVAAIWLVLATGCRIGELMGARWEHIDLEKRRWHLPDTKNQRPHTIHLSEFSLTHFRRLAELRETGPDEQLTPWVFPNRKLSGPVCIKSFGKQLADRQRPPSRRMAGRSKKTESLRLANGRWTAHDLRRTAATIMASLGISTDVIDECLNHVIQSRVSRVYIRDRRETEQARAFDALGAKLSSIVYGAPGANVVPLDARRASA